MSWSTALQLTLREVPYRPPSRSIEIDTETDGREVPSRPPSRSVSQAQWTLAFSTRPLVPYQAGPPYQRRRGSLSRLFPPSTFINVKLSQGFIQAVQDDIALHQESESPVERGVFPLISFAHLRAP